MTTERTEGDVKTILTTLHKLALDMQHELGRLSAAVDASAQPTAPPPDNHETQESTP